MLRPLQLRAVKSSNIITINAETAPRTLTNLGILKAGLKSELDQLSIADAKFKKAYVVIKNMETIRAITSSSPIRIPPSAMINASNNAFRGSLVLPVPFAKTWVQSYPCNGL